MTKYKRRLVTIATLNIYIRMVSISRSVKLRFVVLCVFVTLVTLISLSQHAAILNVPLRQNYQRMYHAPLAKNLSTIDLRFRDVIQTLELSDVIANETSSSSDASTPYNSTTLFDRSFQLHVQNGINDTIQKISVTPQANVTSFGESNVTIRVQNIKQLEAIVRTLVLRRENSDIPSRSLSSGWRRQHPRQNKAAGMKSILHMGAKGDTRSSFHRQQCLIHSFNYLISRNNICADAYPGQGINVLFLIFTIHMNFAQRNALRNTWLTVAKQNTGNIRYVFLLGQTENQELIQKVNAESEKYKDIIKEDFKDAYMNLTLKSIMGYKWAAAYCQKARVVVKTDDDMWINIPRLLNVIEENKNILSNTVLGSCDLNATPIRSAKSKWYASIMSFPQNRYPGFCSGTCYITGMNVVKNVYNVSQNVPFFHLEDVYIGLCLRKLNMRVKNIAGFNRGRPKLEPCLYKNANGLVTSHMLTPAMLTDIWGQECKRHG